MRRLGVCVLAAFAATLLTSGTASAAVPFTSSVFIATHNSYSGNVDGAKNSITYQLDHGVRFIELDIHDNGYDTNHDYSIGHSSPGDLVDHTGGNPASSLLRPWLNLVNSWSNAHPSAAPIVVMLDLKDNLTDNPDYAAGNPAALGDELRAAFGSKLLQAKDYPANPSVDALRGRVLTLLSGDGTTRSAYKRDEGDNAAVAINGSGQVVEVHDSGHGTLWYWSGKYSADGHVTWLRHGDYDTGVTPAIALNANGQLVEVHQSQNATTLWYHVGQVAASGEITWQASHQYDSGVTPTVAFTDATHLREIHASQNTGNHWTWAGVLGSTTVTWSGNAATSSALYNKTSSSSAGRSVHVYTAADGPTPADTLRYNTGVVTGDRIRYPQTAFVEFQDGDSAELQQGALFYAAPADHSSFIVSARNAGKLVRGWDFDSAALATTPLANYPASNTPYASWYQTMVHNAGAVS